MRILNYWRYLMDIAKRREEIRVAIDKLMLRAVGNSWATYETDNILKELSSLGVVIADREAELPDYSDEAPWLRDHSRLVAKEMRSLGYTKTHSLLEETKASLIKDASEVTAIWDLTEGMNPVDFVREMREDKEALDEQDR
jgi:hypothetical protein